MQNSAEQKGIAWMMVAIQHRMLGLQIGIAQAPARAQNTGNQREHLNMATNELSCSSD